jgi:hypothetical protein
MTHPCGCSGKRLQEQHDEPQDAALELDPLKTSLEMN